MKKYNTIIFDLDGTLSNSFEGITKSVQYALEKEGIKVDDLESLRHFIGPPLVDEYKKTYNFDDEKANEATALYRERYVPIGLYETKKYPGTAKMLEVLKNNGKKIALATSKPQHMAEEVLRYLEIDQFFDFVMGAQLHGPRQSKDAVLGALFDEMILPKEETVMVGDTVYDIIGANKVGIDSIAVSYGFGDEEEMLKAGALISVSNTEELTDILLGRK